MKVRRDVFYGFLPRLVENAVGFPVRDREMTAI